MEIVLKATSRPTGRLLQRRFPCRKKFVWPTAAIRLSRRCGNRPDEATRQVFFPASTASWHAMAASIAASFGPTPSAAAIIGYVLSVQKT